MTTPSSETGGSASPTNPPRDSHAGQVGALRAALHAVEMQLDLGRIPREALHDLKREVDEVRLRVWNVMASSRSGDAAVLERFRLRRTIDILQQLAATLRTGTMSPAHGEWDELARMMNLLQGLLRNRRPAAGS